MGLRSSAKEYSAVRLIKLFYRRIVSLLFIFATLLLTACIGDVGKVVVKNFVNPNTDKEAPLIEFLTDPLDPASELKGSQDFTLSYKVEDNLGGKGVASVQLYFTPDLSTLPFSLVGTLLEGTKTVAFCVPNKTLTYPVFKIVAVDKNGNISTKLLGDEPAQRFTSSLTTINPIPVPTLLSNVGEMTSLAAHSLSLGSVCSFNSCSADSLKYLTPTNNVFVLANTDGADQAPAASPLAIDPHWVSCADAFINGLTPDLFTADGEYLYSLWVKSEDVEFDGVTAISPLISTVSATTSIVYDSTPPVEAVTNFTFVDAVDTDGNQISVSWNAFTELHPKEYRLFTYRDSACTASETNHGLTGNTSVTNNTLINNLPDGQYWGKVVAIDQVGLTGASTCSTDSIYIDKNAPVDHGANVQFTEPSSVDGNDIHLTWTAFTDEAKLVNHRILTYRDSSCSTGEVDRGLTATSTNAATLNGLSSTGVYYAKVVAIDIGGNERTSACSTDYISIDVDSPIDHTANLQFVDALVTSRNDIAVTWTAFTDSNGLSNHKIHLYTDATCTTAAGVFDTLSASNSDASAVDVASDGVFWGKVEAFDTLGNSTLSNCSTDFVIVDTIAPLDAPANLQFTATYTAVNDPVAVTWTPFVDPTLENHRLYTYTASDCSTGELDHGWTSSASSTDASVIGPLADGQYWGRVQAKDQLGHITISACSADSVVIDTTAPMDLGANLLFTNDYSNTGNDIAVTWTAFSEVNPANHRLYTYTNDSCTMGEVDHGLTGSTLASNNIIIDGLADGHYWAKVRAVDLAGNTTLSPCSTDEVIVDKTPPTENGANLQFTDLRDIDGDNIAVTWTAFSDTNPIVNHQIITYTNAACTTGAVTHPLTGSGTNSDSATIDGLADGHYWGKVVSFDAAGNSKTSACSTDEIIVDSTAPAGTPNLQFVATYTNVNNSIAVNWTPFTDLTLSDHRLYTYTDSACSSLYVDHGLTASATNSATITGTVFADGQYWGKVRAYDLMGFETLSACSSDSVIVDTTAPFDNGANLQFTNVYSNTGNDVPVTWTAFTEINPANHRLYTYTDSGCAGGETDHGLTGTTVASDAAKIDGLSDGHYWAKVRAVDLAGNTTLSPCSTDEVIVDKTPPTDNGANPQFADPRDIDGNALSVTWMAFSDLNGVVDHEIITYTNSACSTGTQSHGWTGSATASGTTSVHLSDGHYWLKINAKDAAGNVKLSACSTDEIIVDSTAPAGTPNLQFVATYTNVNNSIAVNWTPFTDLTLSDHRLYTYTDSACSSLYVDHGLTASATNSATITGTVFADGQYWGKVRAYDLMGFETLSTCSTDSVVIDTTPPTDIEANLLFTDVYSNTGNDIAVTWTAFSDVNPGNHRLYTYTDSGCTTGEVDHGLTGSTVNSNNVIIDGLADGHYWAKVRAIDLAGNSTLSPCSTDESLSIKRHPQIMEQIFSLQMSIVAQEMISPLLGQPSRIQILSSITRLSLTPIVDVLLAKQFIL